jgi:hypothetical protein
MVQFPTKILKMLLKQIPSCTHFHIPPNIQHQYLKCFLSVLISTVLLHIFITEELQQCSKNGALVLLTAPDIHFAARF